MHGVDDLLEQQLRSFHDDMEAMAGQYKRRCAERMAETMKQELDQLTKSPTPAKPLLYRVRHWSSRQLMALAQRIDPPEPVRDEDDNETGDVVIDAECTVVDRDKPARLNRKQKLRLPSSAKRNRATDEVNEHSTEEGDTNP